MKMPEYNKTLPESIFKHATIMIDKSLSNIMPKDEILKVAEKSVSYGTDRKGHFGNLVEKYVFDIAANSSSEPDFPEAGVELKTTPLKKHAQNNFVAKERLVFSMIDYNNVVNETWEQSSFLHKNKLLLLMFYLYEKNIDLLDYRFKIIQLLSLLNGLSKEDISQIQQDWCFIVNKIRNGKAHELSEGDTFYLGACTKSATSENMRKQPYNQTQLAKPRAFSFKQKFLNHIIQDFLGKKPTEETLFKKKLKTNTIEEYIKVIFEDFIGQKASAIQNSVAPELKKKPKNYYRILVNRILGVKSNRILELEKADVTLRVIVLEKSGSLKESISFPHFDYKEIIEQTWEESDFYQQLSSKKFMFVVFQKTDDNDAILKKVKFWNFPQKDMDKAREVWESTVKNIKKEVFDNFTKISDDKNVHIRPHGKDSNDKIETLSGKMEIKRSFWLNAKYIQNQISK